MKWLIPFLALLLVCCKSHKEVVQTTVASVDSISTMESQTTTTKSQINYSWLFAMADSLRAQWHADSITTPQGATIHNPTLVLNTYEPKVSAKASKTSEEASQEEREDSTAIATHIDDSRIENQAKTVIYEPPDKWVQFAVFGIVVIGLITAILIYLRMRKK